jgi:hypothetical protein
MPLADTAHAAVVEAVLRVRHRMQIDQDLDLVGLGPVEGPVQVLDAADVGRIVPEDEKRNRNPDGVDAVVREIGEVPFGDVRVPVRCEPFAFGDVGEVAGQLGFVLGFRAGEQARAHPLFQDQPVAQVHAFDHEVLPSRTDGQCHSAAVVALPNAPRSRFCWGAS